MNPDMNAAGAPPGGYGPPPGGGYGPPGGGGYGPPGGGGYGPPGGAPPGGGGYGPPGGGGYGPPGGAPPGGGGGGYGPPGGFGPPGGAPPGGFGPPGGAPPGGGGYGPPGGFGPPGGGGYGPPGGFGPPGGINGMPPQGQKSGGNGGLFAGLGIGCLVILGLVGFLVNRAINKTTQAAKEVASAIASSMPPSSGVTTTGGGSGDGTHKVELRKMNLFKKGSINSLYLVGELVNTGTAAVSAPSAKVTLIDGSNTALESTTCIAAGVRGLAPGESVPCYGILGKAPAYVSTKVEGHAFPLYVSLKAAQLKMTDVQTLNPENVYAPYKVVGKVTNESTFTAKSVWIAVGLYAEDELVGVGQAPVAGNDIDANGAAKFEVMVFSVSKPPTRYEAKAFGYDQ